MKDAVIAIFMLIKVIVVLLISLAYQTDYRFVVMHIIAIFCTVYALVICIKAEYEGE